MTETITKDDEILRSKNPSKAIRDFIENNKRHGEGRKIAKKGNYSYASYRGFMCYLAGSPDAHKRLFKAMKEVMSEREVKPNFK